MDCGSPGRPETSAYAHGRPRSWPCKQEPLPWSSVSFPSPARWDCNTGFWPGRCMEPRRPVSEPRVPSYLLISGDFSRWGGMDRVNYELAWHLAERRGAIVHLVGYSIAPPLAQHPRVNWYPVAKPLNSYLVAGPLLARKG